MSLHDRIMSIRLTAEAEIWPAEERIIYKTGNRDARHAAAEMASEADELMAEMEKTMQKALTALEVAQDVYGVGGISGVIEELSELRGKVNEQ